jgi:uroporphyrinogen-III decarboxylase
MIRLSVNDRVHKTLKGEMPDRIPQIIYSAFLHKGSFERKIRNMGLGLDVRCNTHRAFRPNVKVENRIDENFNYTVESTPLGSLSGKSRINLNNGTISSSWIVEYPVKNKVDLEIAKFMVEDTVYEANYEDYIDIEDKLGEDGIITVGTGYSPLMKTILILMGFTNFVLIANHYPDAVKEFLEDLDKKYTELIMLVAKSPAKIVRMGDNIDGVMISPNLFKEYCLPYYNKYADILHKSGKKVIIHMDGRLKSLKNLIAETKIDAVEAFTPPPGGNLSVTEAKKAWKDKVLWINYPEAIFLGTSKQIKDYTLKLLREMAPGRGFIISITEDIHPSHFRKGLKILTETLHKHGKLPIEEI